jgi:hypothetical protein
MLGEDETFTTPRVTRLRMNDYYPKYASLPEKDSGPKRPGRWTGDGAHPYMVLAESCLRSFAPSGEIFFLLRSQPVDLDSHRLKL